MAKTDFEQDLQQQLSALPSERQPERDLWPGIEMALGETAKPQPQRKLAPVLSLHSGWPVALAASVMLVAALSWQWLTQQPSVGPEQNLYLSLSTQHDQQKQALLASFAGQEALTDNWQQQLTQLDQAAGAIRKALAEEPNNIALLRMLQQVHQQQIDLIERVHQPRWSEI